MEIPCVINGIDLIAVSEYILAGSITLSVSLIVALITLSKREQYHKERDKKNIEREDRRRRAFDKKLAALGEARGAAVPIRNEGERRSLQGAELSDWLTSAREAEDAIIDMASKVTKAVGSLVDWQDRVPGLPYSHIDDPDQIQALWNLSGAIIKAETIILMSYRR